AVIIASLAGVPHATVNWLTGVFIALRILYSVAYVTDRASLRSILFILGALCILGLFVAAGMA
ncbi:MAG TPA: MAPEG family protein, partial [Alphaproteobacteria bacterium]|nr:MAPEG family protein [Alphaproteobacteria bacterium]